MANLSDEDGRRRHSAAPKGHSLVAMSLPTFPSGAWDRPRRFLIFWGERHAVLVGRSGDGIDRRRAIIDDAHQ